MRLAVGIIGFAAMAYGGLLLLRRLSVDLLDSALWLGGGVVVHDFILAPVVLVLALAVIPRLPEVARAPVTAGAIVLGSVTLIAVPVLGRFGASPGNPTLLDRDYVTGWLGLAALTVVAVVIAIVTRRSRQPRVAPPADTP